MKRPLLVFFLVLVVLSIASAQTESLYIKPGMGNYYDNYSNMTNLIVGNWDELGQTFTIFQQRYVRPGTFIIVVSILALVFLHMIVFGRKELPLYGAEIRFYSAFNRAVHWTSALSVTVLVLTGLMMIFGKYLGGGSIIRLARYIHGPLGIFTLLPVGLMFLMWVRNAIFTPYDMVWLIHFGGYFSKKEEILPAGKFSAGQKIWFWASTLGIMALSITGFLLFGFFVRLDYLRVTSILHHVFAVAVTVGLIGHVYLVLYIYRGSLRSMLKGTKPESLVQYMHSEFYKKLKA